MGFRSERGDGSRFVVRALIREIHELFNQGCDGPLPQNQSASRRMPTKPFARQSRGDGPLLFRHLVRIDHIA